MRSAHSASDASAPLSHQRAIAQEHRPHQSTARGVTDRATHGGAMAGFESTRQARSSNGKQRCRPKKALLFISSRFRINALGEQALLFLVCSSLSWIPRLRGLIGEISGVEQRCGSGLLPLGGSVGGNSTWDSRVVPRAVSPP